MNQLKQAAEEIRKKRKLNNKKADILELDKMHVNFKKIWLWAAVNRKTKELIGFFIGE